MTLEHICTSPKRSPGHTGFDTADELIFHTADVFMVSRLPQRASFSLTLLPTRTFTLFLSCCLRVSSPMRLQFFVIYFPHSNKDKFYKPSHSAQRGKKSLRMILGISTRWLLNKWYVTENLSLSTF